MKAKLFVCAEKILVDERSKEISTINLRFHTIQPNYPVLIPTDILAYWEKEVGDDDEIQLELRLQQNGEPPAAQPVPVRFNGGDETQTFISIPTLMIPSPGDVTLSFHQGAVTIASWTIRALKASGSSN